MNRLEKTTIISSILLLVISIPNAHAIMFDEQTCMSLLTVEQVKSATGFEKSINVKTVNGDLTELNDHLKSGCAISFEHEDNLQFTLALLASTNLSEEDNREKYSQLVSQTEAMGWPIEFFEENGWEYNAVEIKQMGLGNSLLSIKGDMTIGFNAPPEDTPITTSALVELIKIVHAKVDENLQDASQEQVVCPQGMEPINGKCPDKPVVQTIEPRMIAEKQLSPKKQVSQGVQPEAVRCNEGLVLMIKHNAGTPVCVKSSTADKLYERNWGGIAPPCCKPTEVSSATNFQECIDEGNPAMESYPRQCRTVDGKHFVESIPESKECEMSGGLWGTWSNSQHAEESCNPSTTDVGMECSDSSQCQSFCQAKEGSEIDSESTGMCYGYELALCMQEVANGIVQPEWCQ